MRWSRLVLSLLATAAHGAATCPTVHAADDAYQSRTIQLRSGPLTLEPTERLPPTTRSAAPPAPAEPTPAPAPRRTRSAAPPSPSPEPKRAGQERTVQAPVTAPAPVAKAIGAERVILSFERRITQEEREALAAQGIEVGEFIGETNYTGRVRQATYDEVLRISAPINKIVRLVPLDERNSYIKIDPSLSSRMAPQGNTRSAAPAPTPTVPTEPTLVTVQLWPEADIERVKSDLAAHCEVVKVSPWTRKIEVKLSGYSSIEAIAKIKGVKFVAPSYGAKSQNTHVTRSLGTEAAADPAQQLSGTGIKVGVWDGGHIAANHPSFTGRLTVDLAREGTVRRDNTHATHVAGTIAGTGDYEAPATSSTGPAREGDVPPFGDELTVKRRPPSTGPAVAAETPKGLEQRYPGIAPKASVLSFDFNNAAEELMSVLGETPDAIDVVNNSWSINLQPFNCNQMAAYNVLDAPEFDAVVAGEKNGVPLRRIPILFAAGNARDDAVCGMSTASGFPNYRSVLPPGTAKNVITVGAIDADDASMTDFSGWGPTASGRLKPDIVGPGCRNLSDGERGILSAVPARGIGRMCGTSMATPAVTGVVTLMIEKMVKLGFSKTDIHPSTYKALLIHSAEDLGRPGPDFETGYGRVRLAPALKLMDDRAFLQMRIDSEGQTQVQEIKVAAGLAEIKATLVWDDRPTSVLSDEALANDLDLVLISPTGERQLPFVLNAVPGKEREPARPGVDRLNVVEQVLVANPKEGTWQVEVRAAKIGSPRGGQTYSLVMTTR